MFRTATVLRRALAGREVVELRSSVPAVSARAAAVTGRTVSSVESRGKHLLITFAAREDQRARDAGASRPETTLGGNDRHSVAASSAGRGGATADGHDAEPAPPLDRGRDVAPPRDRRTANARASVPMVDDLVLHTHLGMHGSWHVYRAGQRWRVPERLAALAVVTEAFVAPCFRPAVATLEPSRVAARTPSLRSLGPDAITIDFDAAEARRRLRNLNGVEIGVALLDQRAIAGLGNVYKSEVLFGRRLSPFARVGELPDDELDGLIAESHRLLLRNRGGGARRTVPGVGPRDGLWVYRRSGRPCRVCSGILAMRRQGTDGRSTYYCPRCQSVSIPPPAIRRIGGE
ncbi:MAG: zinc finger domain-containing protein [Candidatus Limnocylindria bacterium]